MNRYSECGTSSGDLNTGGNLSESSFLEVLFGLELGHADSQMTQIFLQLIYHPSRFTGRNRVSCSCLMESHA